MEILIGKQRFDLTDESFKYLNGKVRLSKIPKLNFPVPLLEELKDEDAILSEK
jgi:hypothetical protein